MEVLGLNETFCRALLRAGLTEEYVATRLGVDPKTVRRWIEDRALPYRRHRWALATLLDTAESDLWPQLRSTQPRADEVVAVYPHLSSMPGEVWDHLFRWAHREISLVDDPRLPLVSDHDVVQVLAEQAAAGIRVRICLGDSGGTRTDERSALAGYAPLRNRGEVEIRLHQGEAYSFIYRADDQLLAVQRAYGVPAVQAPVLHLKRTTGGDMFTIYVESFERTWAEARPPSD
jgi:transcriptional regulator with XRE-family HTH domain